MGKYTDGKSAAWAHDYRGGITLFRGDKTIYLQPGDDARKFLDIIEATTDGWDDSDVINDYFDLLGGDEDTDA